jgi:hypothetical protein
MLVYHVLMVIPLALLVACAEPGTLYPLDRKATEQGQLRISPCTSEGAEMQISIPDGGILTGLCKITVDYSPWIPRLSSLAGVGAYSALPEAAISSSGEISTGMVPPRVLDPRFAEYPIPGARGVEIVLSGDNGARALCWYFISVFTHTGAGTCQFSSGADYLLVF